MASPSTPFLLFRCHHPPEISFDLPCSNSWAPSSGYPTAPDPISPLRPPFLPNTKTPRPKGISTRPNTSFDTLRVLHLTASSSIVPLIIFSKAFSTFRRSVTTNSQGYPMSTEVPNTNPYPTTQTSPSNYINQDLYQATSLPFMALYIGHRNVNRLRQDHPPNPKFKPQMSVAKIFYIFRN